MESLLPSEVARLVFGYLDDEDCVESAQNFLESSPHLKECLNIRKRGKRFSTKILGLTLVEILDFVSDLAIIVRDHEKFIDWNNYDKGRVNSLMKILNFENGRSKSMTPIGSGANSRSEVSVSPSKSPQEIRNSTAIISNPTYSFENVDFNGLGNDPFEKLCGFIKKGSNVRRKEEKELLTFLASAAEYWVQDRIVLLRLKEENEKLSQKLYISEAKKEPLENDEVTYTITDKVDNLPKDLLRLNAKEIIAGSAFEELDKHEIVEMIKKESPKDESDDVNSAECKDSLDGKSEKSDSKNDNASVMVTSVKSNRFLKKGVGYNTKRRPPFQF